MAGRGEQQQGWGELPPHCPALQGLYVLCPPRTVLQALLATPSLAQRRGCWMCPLRTVVWVLCATHLRSITGGVSCPPPRHPPPPLQPSWPRASPQHSPYLNTYRLRTSRHRLQQPRAYHSSATRPLPGKKKNQNIPAGYPASPSLLWFSISICQGGSSTSPSRSLRLCLPGSRLCQTPLAMAASGVSRWAG